MKTSMPLCATALAAALAAAAFGVSAQVAAPAGPASLSITRLQTIYLRCADVATRSPLDAVDFASARRSVTRCGIGPSTAASSA